MELKSIYDIPLNSADGEPNFLEQFKGKATMIVNTTVGCGNANQMQVLQWLQDKYDSKYFQVVAIPTNDYCGVGITKGKWSQGITCGADSQAYGRDVYGTTFKFSEMVSSIPSSGVSAQLGVQQGHNGLGQPYGEPHDLYKQIQKHQFIAQNKLKDLNLLDSMMSEEKYYSWWLNLGFYFGTEMGGNFEKYLVDKDGFVDKHYQCTVLNWDIEATLKEDMEKQNVKVSMGLGRSKKVFEEEWTVICENIEQLIMGRMSIVNPRNG